MANRLTLGVDPVLVAGLVRASYESDLGELKAFLPSRVPLEDLPPPFAPYLSACAELPAHYTEESGGTRRWLEREFRRELPSVRHALSTLSEAETDTLMTALSVLAHTYRWDG